MSDTAGIKAKAEAAQNGKSKGFLFFLRDWFLRNDFYFIAFLIPVVVMYAAYAIFKIYPFGDNSVLVLDLNGQYVYYFETLRDAFWSGDKSALYNWSRNLSGGFNGVIGYYLASPFTLIVMLLPRTMLLGSLLIMQLTKLGSAAAAFCYYLRKSKGLNKVHSIMFSTLYSLCAYAVIQLIDPMWLDGLVFLPLIVLGIEYLVDDGRKLNFIIPLAIMMIANFYIGYMICIFSALYFLFYIVFGCKNAGKKRKITDILMTLVRMGISVITALACAAIMILPVYNALKLGKFDFTEPDFSYATQFKFLDFFAQLMVAQYDSVNVEGHPEIYCGIITALLVPAFFVNKDINKFKKAGYILLTAILVACMLIRPVDMVWHGFQMPNWLPFRYSFVFSFVLLSMAAETFKNFKGVKLSAIGGSFALAAVFLMISLSRVIEDDILKFDENKIDDFTKKDIWICLALAAVYSIILFILRKAMGNQEPAEAETVESEKSGTEAVTETKAAEGSEAKTDTEAEKAAETGSEKAPEAEEKETKAEKAKPKSKAKPVSKAARVLTAILPVIIIGVSCGELLYNAVDTLKSEDVEIVYSKRSSWYNFINNGREVTNAVYDYDKGFYRAEKTFHRTVNDTAAFGLRGVSHSSSVMNAKILKFLEAMGYSASSYYSRYDGATPITDSVLGIKYTMDRNAKKDVGTESYKRLADPAYVSAFSYEYKNEKDEDTIIDVYKNPYALSMGFMADKNILNIEKFGNDNTFNSQNILLSTISGNTQIDFTTGQFISFNEYFKKLDINPENFVLNNVTTSPYGEQTMYTAGEGDPTVDMYITVPSEKPIYLFFKTENQKEVNLWLSEPDENGEYVKADFVGSYFENHNYHTVCLGQFTPGEVIRLRMTVANEYTIVKNFFFCEFDEELFAESIDVLKKNQWELTKAGGRSLEGTITAEEGKLMLTSIPYEPGWTVKVDGKKTEPKEIAQALIGVELEPGKHTVKMTYTPPGFTVGAVLLVVGVVFIVLIYMYDKKHNKMLIELRRAKHMDSVKPQSK